jgi:aspartyl-tRNA(Asn)/glutamyl-tRNA(Gln) amidotransferase subunit C
MCGDSPVADVTLDEVRHVAHLARLDLPDEELERVRRELNRIMDHFAELQELDTDDVDQTSHAIRMTNVYRPDEVSPGIDVDAVVQNAPDSVEGFFRVPAFMEEE